MIKVNYDEIKLLLKSRLTEQRFIHSLNVADMAQKLADRYDADREKAYFAGLVHDSTKNIPDNEQLQIMKNGGIILTSEEKSNPSLYHSISGSVYVRDELKCFDDEIISAIRYHTTGKANMTLLEKIIYVADFISAERNFNGVEYMRKLAFEDLDKACLFAVDFSIPNLIGRRVVLHPDTVALYNDLIMKKVNLPEEEG